ncbi:MAG: polyphenol oxidase family protein [Gemmatimonadota bacterium]
MLDGTPTAQDFVEEELAGPPPLLARSDWTRHHPWLIQGVTVSRTAGPDAADFRLFGKEPGAGVLDRWEALRIATGMNLVVHARQLHGTGVRVARGGATGILLAPPCDGHLAGEPGILLTVALADCVPVFLLEPESRTLGLLHAGWRGTAAGILEVGLREMWDRFGVPAAKMHVHLGPAIGPDRYEVGSEVLEALGIEGRSGPLLDLRKVLADRARSMGVPAEQVGVSSTCVHDDPRFFSHRAGDEGRHLAVFGYLGRPGERR